MTIEDDMEVVRAAVRSCIERNGPAPMVLVPIPEQCGCAPHGVRCGASPRALFVHPIGLALPLCRRHLNALAALLPLMNDLAIVYERVSNDGYDDPVSDDGYDDPDDGITCTYGDLDPEDES